MFKFGFSSDDKTDDPVKETLSWEAARDLTSAASFSVAPADRQDTTTRSFASQCLTLLDPELVLARVSKSSSSIAEAENSHSDLVPAKYEGGFKIWECTEDLAAFLWKDKQPDPAYQKVLDLGCGAGVLGILALLHGASAVHFQDYNEDVLTHLTMPNVALNCREPEKSCRFYSGDWQSFAAMDTGLYDSILTAETIYNADSHSKLLAVFDKKLSPDGVIFLAAKTYYFGVGGGLRSFEQLLLRGGRFRSQVVWSCSEGVQREILQITRAVPT